MSISIGICCYNEERNIAKLLDNILTKQALPPDSEILVICSGCTDSSPEIVKRFCEKDTRVKLILEEERKGKASAVNEILKRYVGDFLLLIPADVVPAPFSFSRLLEKMSSNPCVGVVCGKPVPINTERGFSGYLAHLIWRLHNRTLKFLNDLNLSSHASGELMVVRRGIVQKIPIDVVNEDAYIAIQAFSKNFLVKYSEEAKVYIKAPTNIVDFIRQRRRVVYGHHRTKQVTKYYPRTLENMVFYDPQKPVRVITEEIREHPRDILKFLIAVYVEVLVNFLAIIDFILKKEHTIWAIVKSTKEI